MWGGLIYEIDRKRLKIKQIYIPDQAIGLILFAVKFLDKISYWVFLRLKVVIIDLSFLMKDFYHFEVFMTKKKMNLPYAQKGWRVQPLM